MKVAQEKLVTNRAKEGEILEESKGDESRTGKTPMSKAERKKMKKAKEQGEDFNEETKEAPAGKPKKLDLKKQKAHGKVEMDQKELEEYNELRRKEFLE